jgi:hypothetical protein
MLVQAAESSLVERGARAAHFHAEHAGQQAKFDFAGALIAGEIASRHANQRIREWAQLHRAELDANWAKMKAGQPLESIAPLSSKKKP